MKEFILYFHRKKVDNSIFYVGIGHEHRAYDFRRRNRHWEFVANKHEVIVQIVERFKTRKEAEERERYYIKKFGRKGYDPNGILCNVTKGGEGTLGCNPWNKGKKGVYSEETKKIMGLNKKGKPLKEETKKRLSLALKNRKLSSETKIKLSINKKGINNPVSKSVIDVNTNRVFATAVETAEYFNMSMDYFKKMLSGLCPNYTSCLYVDDYIKRFTSSEWHTDKRHILYNPTTVRQVKLNKLVGVTKSHCKWVVDDKTKVVYYSVQEAAKAAGFCLGYFTAMLRGRKKNVTTFHYFDNLSARDIIPKAA